jgi:hypothetical protein
MKVGDKVTRSGSKIWEIAETATAGQIFTGLSVTVMGGPEAEIYRLKDATTGKIQRNLWWTAEDLKLV